MPAIAANDANALRQLLENPNHLCFAVYPLSNDNLINAAFHINDLQKVLELAHVFGGPYTDEIDFINDLRKNIVLKDPRDKLKIKILQSGDTPPFVSSVFLSFLTENNVNSERIVRIAESERIFNDRQQKRLEFLLQKNRAKIFVSDREIWWQTWGILVGVVSAYNLIFSSSLWILLFIPASVTFIRRNSILSVIGYIAALSIVLSSTTLLNILIPTAIAYEGVRLLDFYRRFSATYYPDKLSKYKNPTTFVEGFKAVFDGCRHLFPAYASTEYNEKNLLENIEDNNERQALIEGYKAGLDETYKTYLLAYGDPNNWRPRNLLAFSAGLKAAEKQDDEVTRALGLSV